MMVLLQVSLAHFRELWVAFQLCGAEEITSLCEFHLWLEARPLDSAFQQAGSFRVAISGAVETYQGDITGLMRRFASFIFLFADQRKLQTIMCNCAIITDLWEK